ELEMAVDSNLAVLSTPGGLTVSAHDAPRTIGNMLAQSLRSSHVDLQGLEEKDPAALNRRLDAMVAEAAGSEGRPRDVARLELAQYYGANQRSYEALGVLDVMEAGLEAEDLTRKMRMTRAIASTLAGRPADALSILNADSMGQEVDALI